MKKAITFPGALPLFLLCGLLALYAGIGPANTVYRHALELGMAVLLLASGGELLLSSLLVAVKVAQSVVGGLRGMRHLLRQAATSSWEITLSAGWPAGGITLNPLLVAALFIVVGLLSPSDGVDSARDLPPMVVLARGGVCLAAGVGCFVVFQFVRRRRGKTDRSAMPSHETSAKAAVEMANQFDLVDSQ